MSRYLLVGSIIAHACSNVGPLPAQRYPSGSEPRPTTNVENAFQNAGDDPLSTFSIDVDTASYTLARSNIFQSRLPLPSDVRVEEFINYFDYQYGSPDPEAPIGIFLEQSKSPWKPANQIIRIALNTRALTDEQASEIRNNFIFLVDVSGSMEAENKLSLVKRSMMYLVEQLKPSDRVAIVTYAGRAGVQLNATSADEKDVISSAIDGLEARGSTNGASGLDLAYAIAIENFVSGGNNRVILATDGDFNVGSTNPDELVDIVRERSQQGVYMTVLGFGDNRSFSDQLLERIGDDANGNYFFIDSMTEAKTQLSARALANLHVVAKDVKIQVEFNPRLVNKYRLIGYEDRILSPEDFNDDQRDAGEMGPGHNVTAIYEIEPRGADGIRYGTVYSRGVDDLVYQNSEGLTERAQSNEWLNIRIRYKDPEDTESKLLEHSFARKDSEFQAASTDFRFALSAAAFGMYLRQSGYLGITDLATILSWASASLGDDKQGIRAEMCELIKRTMIIEASAGLKVVR